MRTHFVPIVLLSSVLCSGCGTIMAHRLSGEDRLNGVYQSVRADCVVVSGDQLPGPFMVLDLPLSLAADTLVLPYDIIDSTGRKEGPAHSAHSSSDEPQIGRVPSIVQPDRVERAVQKLRRDVGFAWSGVAFFKGHLYASCNVGLLEIEGAAVQRAYCWKHPNSVVDGPWVDSLNDRLWVWLFPNGGLANFDGEVWKGARLPVPADMVRGDWLEGYRGFCSTNAFWLEGGRDAWEWDSALQQWREAPNLHLPAFERQRQGPPANGAGETDWRVAPGSLRRMFFAQGTPYVVVTYMGSFPPERSSPWFLGDSVYRLDSRWLEVSNLTGEPYLVRQTVSVAETGFMRTTEGKVLKVTTEGISTIESPGFCDALTTTSGGTLLAAFRGLGVYELSGAWKLRFKLPDDMDGSVLWAYLAENEGRVALALHSLSESRLAKGKTRCTSRAALWVSQGTEPIKVQFPTAPTKSWIRDW